MYEILNKINGPEDVKKLNIKELENLAEDIICDIEESSQEHLKNDYKHTMQLNRNLRIGLLKI